MTLNLTSGMQTYWSELYGSGQSRAICETAQQQKAPVVVIVPDNTQLQQIHQELMFFASENIEILIFPDLETLPYDKFSPHQDIISERLLTLNKLLTLKTGIVLVAVSTLMQLLTPKSYIEANCLILNQYQKLDLIDFRNVLTKRGYYHVDRVVQHGEFTIRGSIIDIFPTGSPLPYRIDLFDNDIDSIRQFDPDTQRSLQEVDNIRLLPAREFPLTKDAIQLFQKRWQQNFTSDPNNCPIYEIISRADSAPGIEYYLPLFFDELQTFFDYLPANSILVTPEKLHAAAEHYWIEINERYEQLRYDITNPLLSPIQIFLPVDKLFAQFKHFPHIVISHKTHKKDAEAICFRNKKLPDLTIDNQAKQPLHKLQKFLVKRQPRILFCADSPGRREALLELLQRIDITPAQYNSWDEFSHNTTAYGICIAQLEQGSYSNEIIIIPEALLFGHQIMQRRRRQEKQQDTGAIIRDLVELHIGDPVVHIDHGIGRYLGLQTITVDQQPAEYLTLEYANKAKLYVPIASLQLVSRYMGSNPENAPYNTLGSKHWETVKTKAAKKISDIAAELLDIYARRAAKKGQAFTKPDQQYQQFANTFPFETTPDQQNSIDAVLNDMMSPNSMDRLVCGDVGFGKTEVAMRAAFLAVQNQKQVAILVPTTLLAQQHYTNFQDRFADWPVNIGMLSRFNTTQEQHEIIAKLATGGIDIVIGTHKLIQANIKFKDLGLLIIDEEHRFGVRQKEKIKSWRATVDILTLTATPIPRTLGMALAGIRDLSIIATPPAKRLSVKTFVHETNNALIREAIVRETMRGGQVYFVHNDISTITRTAAKLQELVPEAKIQIAHGQMREKDLSQIMRDFYHNRLNVLVCTTIIESGIDIPTANTIIINRADRLGLAQLHQLRGRVGRSHHQAYAYLLVPEKAALKGDAKKRLEAIEIIKDLGAGFTLATHDLEIRGAGEILGEDQSGQIQAIGYNLYMDFLDSAVAALKSGKQPELLQPLQQGTEIDLQIPALIPDTYVFDVDTRLTLYKRIANAQTKAALHELQVELIDRFGLLPQQTKNLFAVTELKLRAETIGIHKIKAGSKNGYIEFTAKPNIEPLNIIKLIQKHPDIYKFDGKTKLKFTWQHPEAEKWLAELDGLFNKIVLPNK